jgi:hypothetical protein
VIFNIRGYFGGAKLAVGMEVKPETWHTVILLVPGCVLLKVKAGPFDPN